LVGVESTTCPASLRKVAWARLAKELPTDLLEQIFQIISLEEVPQFSDNLLAGQINGRVVVDVTL
jgi:acrylyl-CoA reductase (NADPH)